MKRANFKKLAAHLVETMNALHRHDEDFHITAEVKDMTPPWIEVLPKQNGSFFDNTIFCGIELAMFAQVYNLRMNIIVTDRYTQPRPKVVLFPSFTIED